MKLLKKIKVKSVELKTRLKQKYDPDLYKFIAADITSNCNLRCPFCLNDFTGISGNTFMEETTFEKILPLIPLAPVAGFGISCLYEPCLHPRFVDFMEKIPAKHFERVFFTTNLSMKFSDEDFQRLSRCHIHHVNISIDSLTPSIYETLRKNAKFDRFIHNLERMVTIFKQNPNAPKIRFSTVVLQSNLSEVPALVKTCAEKYSASVHELRFVYQIDHVGKEWRKENLIANEDWAKLQAFAAQCPFTCEVVPPGNIYYPEDNMPYSRKPVPTPSPGNASTGSTDAPSETLPLGLRISADGTVSLYGKDDVNFNIHQIDAPYAFFNHRRKQFNRLLKS